MTGPEIAVMRQLAERVLTHQAGADPDAAALSSAARGAYEELIRVLAPLIGQLGVDAVTARAVHLARREYPWLANTREPDSAEAPLTRISLFSEPQDPPLTLEAAAGVFATFLGLLASMIGHSLTTRLVRQAWPAVVDTGTKETRA